MWEIDAKGIRITNIQALTGCPCICPIYGGWEAADTLGLIVGGCGCGCRKDDPANLEANGDKADIMV